MGNGGSTGEQVMQVGLGGWFLRKRWLIAPVALAAAATAATPAVAQQVKTELAVTARGEYDDNILRLPENATPKPGSSRSDFTQQYRLQGSVSGDIGLQTLYLNATLGQSIHAENTLLDALTADAEGGLAWRLGSRCSGTLAGLYTRSQSDLELLDDTASNIQTSIGAKAGASCLVAGYFTPSVEVSTRSTTSSLETQERADVDERALTASLFYERADLSAMGLTVTAVERTYPNGIDRDGGALDPSTQVDARLVTRRKLTDKVQAEVSIGGTQFLGAVEDGPFLVFDGNLQWAATPKVGVTAAYERSVGVSSVVQSNFTTKDTATLGVAYALTPKINVGGELSYAETTFDGATSQTESGAPTDRLDQLYGGKLTIGYEVYPAVQITTGYGYASQTSTIDRGNFTSQRVFAGLAVTF